MLFERLRRIDVEFLPLNTLNEARRFAGFASTVNNGFFFSLMMFFGLYVKGKMKFISFSITSATLTKKAQGNCVVFLPQTHCAKLERAV
jgi:hypothetical protein